MSVATVSELRQLASDLGVPAPTEDAECERLLDRAQDVVEAIGLRVRLTSEHLGELDAAQTAALKLAVVKQAIWDDDAADESLGPSNVASAEGITFATSNARPRIAPAVLESLALHGLVARTGTAPPDPTPVVPPVPWWWWI